MSTQAKKPAKLRRQAIVEEVRRKDMLKEKVKQPRQGFRNPKPREVEVPCCLDKNRPLPMVFRQCPDCPKLTEAGPIPKVVAQITEAESKQGRGTKKTRAGSKPRRGSKLTGAGSTTD
jgi:hypothetical protein